MIKTDLTNEHLENAYWQHVNAANNTEYSYRKGFYSGNAFAYGVILGYDDLKIAKDLKIGSELIN